MTERVNPSWPYRDVSNWPYLVVLIHLLIVPGVRHATSLLPGRTGHDSSGSFRPSLTADGSRVLWMNVILLTAVATSRA